MRFAFVSTAWGDLWTGPRHALFEALRARGHEVAWFDTHRRLAIETALRPPALTLLDPSERGLALAVALTAARRRAFVLVAPGEPWPSRFAPPVPLPAVGSATLAGTAALRAAGLSARYFPPPPPRPRLRDFEVEGLRRALELGPGQLWVLTLDAPLERDAQLALRQHAPPGTTIVIIAPAELHGALVPLAMASRVSTFVRLVEPTDEVAGLVGEAADLALFADEATLETRRLALQGAGRAAAVMSLRHPELAPELARYGILRVEPWSGPGATAGPGPRPAAQTPERVVSLADRVVELEALAAGR